MRSSAELPGTSAAKRAAFGITCTGCRALDHCSVMPASVRLVSAYSSFRRYLRPASSVMLPLCAPEPVQSCLSFTHRVAISVALLVLVLKV